MNIGISKSTYIWWVIHHALWVINILLFLFLLDFAPILLREFHNASPGMILGTLTIGLGIPLIGITLFQISDMMDNGKPIIGTPIGIMVMVCIFITYFISKT